MDWMYMNGVMWIVGPTELWRCDDVVMVEGMPVGLNWHRVK